MKGTVYVRNYIKKNKKSFGKRLVAISCVGKAAYFANQIWREIQNSYKKARTALTGFAGGLGGAEAVRLAADQL